MVSHLYDNSDDYYGKLLYNNFDNYIGKAFVYND